ncbi:MAG: tetratricopeptide repeat protein, partial [Elusimicrobia bacterium]|nr:tetratricopeptide repeat protein [Elusimicrobiota bacterium]
MKSSQFRALCFALLIFVVSPQKSEASTKASYMHYLRGLLLEQQGSYADALAEYRMTLMLDPRSTFVYEQALELAMRIGQTDQALQWAQNLVQLEPREPRSYVLLGNVCWTRGETEKARANFAKALSLDAKYPQALLSLANLLSSSKPGEALKYLKAYQKVNPESGPELKVQIALLEHRQGKTAIAIAYLKQAIQDQPEYLQTRYSLAQLYEVVRDTQAALKEYLSILPMDPQNVALLNRLGEMTAQQGQGSQAEEYFLKVLELEPRNPTACLWLSLLSERKSDWQKAAEYLSLNPMLVEDPGLHLRLSYYMTQAGRMRDALEVLESAHGRWPRNEEI